MTKKWLFWFVGSWIIQANVFAQLSEGGIPPSFQFQPTLRSRAATVQVPVTFNVKDLIMVDEWQASQGVPLLAVAKLIDVQHNPTNAGVWSTLPDGTKIWQFNLQAKNAIALMIYYSDFYIPEGGKLFIYNAEKTQILGAYTQHTHPAGGRFATEFVAGDELTFEYVTSPAGEMPRIEIEAIGYGYNHLTVQNSSVSLRKAAPCEVNVNCEEGDAWQNQKKGVCYMTQRINNKTYACTGSLVNNTAQDLKPYILSAQHCACSLTYVEASPEEMEQWVFYFHHERQRCNSNSSPTASKTIVGCKKIAATTINKESDGLLLLLNRAIPADYNVYYNGWDRRNQPAKSGVSIHHPESDYYKKISTFYTPAIHYTFKSSDGIICDTNAHWNVTFEETLNGHGVTEKGSSGAPLFNENKLIVGTLTGGNSDCDKPGGLNIYGKLSYHWNKYTNSDTTRMDIWLDPTRKGVEILEGRFHQAQIPAPLNLNAVYQYQTVLLTWIAPASGKPLKYNVYNNNLKIGETASLTFTDQTPQFGTQTYSVSSVYENGNESNFTNVSVSVLEYKAPNNVIVTQTTSQQIAVQWEPPLYEQTIYWGENSAMWQITINRTAPFYFGQTWSKNEIKPFHKRTITAVKFIAVRNNTYEIYIAQGKRTYRQAIKNPAAGITSTVQLTAPFVIDEAENLIVAIHVTKLSTSDKEYPAVCDGGPAVQGKGNIYSFDGQTWSNLYDKTVNPDEFDYDINFFVAAIVSSVEKDILVTTTNFLEQKNPATSVTAEMQIAPLTEEISLRSIRPAPFPEITNYYIYRDNVRIATVPSVPGRYIEKMPAKETEYQVSALYGTIEGQRSKPVSINPVNNLQIEPKDIRLYPTIFTNQVELTGYEYISKVEIYNATGQLSLRIDKPDKIIHTESLQPGVYFFRIYTDNDETVNVLRGVRKR